MSRPPYRFLNPFTHQSSKYCIDFQSSAIHQSDPESLHFQYCCQGWSVVGSPNINLGGQHTLDPEMKASKAL